MKITQHTGRKIASIRFRRWSRKPYAVFVGIKKNISIGKLTKGVTERLLLKSNTLEIIVPQGSHLSLQVKSMEEILSQESCILSPVLSETAC